MTGILVGRTQLEKRAGRVENGSTRIQKSRGVCFDGGHVWFGEKPNDNGYK